MWSLMQNELYFTKVLGMLDWVYLYFLGNVWSFTKKNYKIWNQI